MSNALAAIALGLAYEVTMDTIKRQLATFSGQRQNILKIHGYTVIDDAYNASPDSMKAGLRILADYKDSGRKSAVLSDMLELGPDSPDYHREVGEFLGTADITDLYITGTLSKKYAEAAQKKNLSLKTKWFSSNDELISYL